MTKEPIFTPEQVKTALESSELGAVSHSAAVRAFADKLGTSEQSVWRYLKDGVPPGAPKFIQRQLEEALEKKLA